MIWRMPRRSGVHSLGASWRSRCPLALPVTGHLLVAGKAANSSTGLAFHAALGGRYRPPVGHGGGVVIAKASPSRQTRPRVAAVPFRPARNMRQYTCCHTPLILMTLFSRFHCRPSSGFRQVIARRGTAIRSATPRRQPIGYPNRP